MKKKMIMVIAAALLVFTGAFSVNAQTLGLEYSTYLGGNGGSGNSIARAIVLGSDGSAYIAGQTYSNSFPTVNPYQASRAGWDEAIVCRLSPSGSSLIFSTYLEGDAGA